MPIYKSQYVLDFAEGEVESSAVSTLCKHVEEADRLYKYLQPLM